MAERADSPASGSISSSQIPPADESFLSNFIDEIIKSPVNLVLVCVIAFLVFKIFRSKTKDEPPAPEHKELPRIRRDFNVEDLKKYDGKGPDGRILVAVNGSVYDVTRGRRFYGPGNLFIYLFIFVILIYYFISSTYFFFYSKSCQRIIVINNSDFNEFVTAC